MLGRCDQAVDPTLAGQNRLLSTEYRISGVVGFAPVVFNHEG